MTKSELIFKALEPLSVGEKLEKKPFIELHWGRCDYFVERSFDVAYCNARKMFPEKKFKSFRKIITRIE